MGKAAKEHIIFALDVPTYDRAMYYVDLLKEHVGLFKIGLELFISEGPAVVKAVKEAAGAGVFLDLKLYDIPATVKRSIIAAGRYGVDFITVHSEGAANIPSELTQGEGGKTGILAVTVLTSLGRDDLARLGYASEYAEDISSLVLLRAALAREAGCHGVVCSAREAAMVKDRVDKSLVVVTPGIRPGWVEEGKDDQKRVLGPRDAIQNGADYIVVGRPIRDAKDPVDAAKRVAEEIGSGL